MVNEFWEKKMQTMSLQEKRTAIIIDIEKATEKLHSKSICDEEIERINKVLAFLKEELAKTEKELNKLRSKPIIANPF